MVTGRSSIMNESEEPNFNPFLYGGEIIEVTTFSDEKPQYIPGVDGMKCLHCGTYAEVSSFHPGTCGNCGAPLPIQ